MELRPYITRPKIAQMLYRKGYLRKMPYQEDRSDLRHNDGVDIVYELKELSPEQFQEASDTLLAAAEEEAERYKDIKYKYAKIDVKLNRTIKARKKIPEIRTYVASTHTDHQIMIYGESKLGYTLPTGERIFLNQQMEDILDIPNTNSPGAFVKKQKPFTVIKLIIAIRTGKKEATQSKLMSGKEVPY